MNFVFPAKPAFVPNCQPTQKESVNDHTLSSPLPPPRFRPLLKIQKKQKQGCVENGNTRISVVLEFGQLLRRSAEKSCLPISDMICSFVGSMKESEILERIFTCGLFKLYRTLTHEFFRMENRIGLRLISAFKISSYLPKIPRTLIRIPKLGVDYVMYRRYYLGIAYLHLEIKLPAEPVHPNCD